MDARYASLSRIKMEFKRIDDINDVDFADAWEIYEYSFPDDEKRSLDAQRIAFKEKIYGFYAAKKDNQVIGLMAVWDIGDYYFVDHIATSKELRGQGLGAQVMREFIAQHQKRFVLEVEPPTAGEMEKRRIGFYERLGYKFNNYDYTQPPMEPGKDTVKLFLMTYPDEMTEEEFDRVRERLHKIVYKQKEVIK